MLTGLLAPTSGRIEILGLDLNARPVDVKRQIGVVPEGMSLFGRLTGAEFLNFAGRMYGLTRETAAQRANELLDFMQLADQPKKLVTDYSHGMQKKLAMAAAVIHAPKVLFLDEPFEGVDAIAAGTIKAMLQGMIARGATIFLTSHVLEIVERLCSHVAIIHQGKLVAQGSLEELRAGVGAQTPAGSCDGAQPSSGEKMTLEDDCLALAQGDAWNLLAGTSSRRLSTSGSGVAWTSSERASPTTTPTGRGPTSSSRPPRRPRTVNRSARTFTGRPATTLSPPSTPRAASPRP